MLGSKKGTCNNFVIAINLCFFLFYSQSTSMLRTGLPLGGVPVPVLSLPEIHKTNASEGLFEHQIWSNSTSIATHSSQDFLAVSRTCSAFILTTAGYSFVRFHATKPNGHHTFDLLLTSLTSMKEQQCG